MRMVLLQTCYCCSSLKQLTLVGGCFTLILSSLYVFIYYGGESGAFTMVKAVHSNRSNHGPQWPHSNATQAAVADPVLQEATSLSDGSDNREAFIKGSGHHLDRMTMQVVQGSIINPEGFDLKEGYAFYLSKFICDIAVIVCSVILFIALYKENRMYLIPWITMSTIQAGFCLGESFSKLSLKTTQFEPKTAFIFTFTFLLIFGQIYFILGGISLYQDDFCYTYNNNNNSTNVYHQRRRIRRNASLQGGAQSRETKQLFSSSTAHFIPMKVLHKGQGTILTKAGGTQLFQVPDSKSMIPTLLIDSDHRPLNTTSVDTLETGLGVPAVEQLELPESAPRSKVKTKLEVIEEVSSTQGVDEDQDNDGSSSPRPGSRYSSHTPSSSSLPGGLSGGANQDAQAKSQGKPGKNPPPPPAEGQLGARPSKGIEKEDDPRIQSNDTTIPKHEGGPPSTLEAPTAFCALLSSSTTTAETPTGLDVKSPMVKNFWPNAKLVLKYFATGSTNPVQEPALEVNNKSKTLSQTTILSPPINPRPFRGLSRSSPVTIRVGTEVTLAEAEDDDELCEAVW